jgi:large subunit ribosomal protein L13
LQPLIFSTNKVVDSISYKTVYANKATIQKNWYVVDASDKILGRLSTQIAAALIGKNKTDYTPNSDNGDCVIVINAGKVKLSGSKMATKEYITYSGFPGGQKRITAEDLINKKPVKLIEEAVKGMLPKNKLGSRMYTNLFVYEGDTHPHEAQQPKELKIKI